MSALDAIVAQTNRLSVTVARLDASNPAGAASAAMKNEDREREVLRAKLKTAKGAELERVKDELAKYEGSRRDSVPAGLNEARNDTQEMTPRQINSKISDGWEVQTEARANGSLFEMRNPKGQTVQCRLRGEPNEMGWRTDSAKPSLENYVESIKQFSERGMSSTVAMLKRELQAHGPAGKPFLERVKDYK